MGFAVRVQQGNTVEGPLWNVCSALLVTVVPLLDKTQCFVVKDSIRISVMAPAAPVRWARIALLIGHAASHVMPATNVAIQHKAKFYAILGFIL